MRTDRRGLLAVVAAVAVVAAGVGWVLGQRIKSPAEVAAETAPPEPSLITVPVEERELSSRVVVRGTVQSSEETPIRIAGAADGTPIVTRMPKESGDQLDEGEVAIEITGRPVVVLQGELPVYRSMGPSMEGPDVEQLESSLLRLGFDPGEVDGLYTASTATAVENLYRSLGYKPSGPSPEEQAALDAAQDRVTQAQRLVDQAGGSSGGVPESVRLQANLQVDQAKRAVEEAKAAKHAGLAELAAAVKSAESALAEARQALTVAEERLAEARNGSHPDTGAPPSADELAILESDVEIARATVGEQESALAAAKSAQSAQATSFDNTITDAEAQVKIAVASRSETFASHTDGGGEGGASLADARRELSDARSDLADLQAVTGVGFPAFELVFVPTLPRQVQSVSVSLGSAAVDSVMSVTGTSTVIESAVPTADRKLLVEGLEAIVEDDELGLSAAATITFLADDPGGGELPDDRFAMRLTPADDLPEEAFRQSLRVTIPISSTGGEVLAVPLAAVSAGADGGSRVEVQDADGSTRLVDVVTGLAADGFVEITPRGATLEPGDRVVVGRDLQLPDAGDPDSSGDDAESGDEEQEDEGDAFGQAVRG